jgi:hypothetical protein
MGIITNLQASTDLPWINTTLFPHLRHHCHYHIVVKEVCRSLDEFRTSKEAVIAIRDAVEGSSCVIKSIPVAEQPTPDSSEPRTGPWSHASRRQYRQHPHHQRWTRHPK